MEWFEDVFSVAALVAVVVVVLLVDVFARVVLLVLLGSELGVGGEGCGTGGGKRGSERRVQRPTWNNACGTWQGHDVLVSWCCAHQFRVVFCAAFLRIYKKCVNLL